MMVAPPLDHDELERGLRVTHACNSGIRCILKHEEIFTFSSRNEQLVYLHEYAKEHAFLSLNDSSLGKVYNITE